MQPGDSEVSSILVPSIEIADGETLEHNRPRGVALFIIATCVSSSMSFLEKVSLKQTRRNGFVIFVDSVFQSEDKSPEMLEASFRTFDFGFGFFRA